MDGGNPTMRILLTRLYLLFLAGLILLGTSYWQPGLWGASVILFAALLLVSAAVAGRMWCSLYIAGYKNSQLVRTGPYSLCRNPLYLFSLMGAVGIGITTWTFTIPVLVAVAFAVYYPAVIKKEEAVLRKKHGVDFESYCLEVPSFLPNHAGFQQPETYEVKPRVFLNHLASAVWFILALGVIQLLKAAQLAGHLPALFTLY
jgi:protein-S-isoprenylcysteine O-methyltransferase Ste14